MYEALVNCIEDFVVRIIVATIKLNTTPAQVAPGFIHRSKLLNATTGCAFKYLVYIFLLYKQDYPTYVFVNSLFLC